MANPLHTANKISPSINQSLQSDGEGLKSESAQLLKNNEETKSPLQSEKLPDQKQNG